MKMRDEQIKKVCSFYVNDWHLTTTILPYIYKQIHKNNKIIPILQNGIQTNIQEILSKMNLNKKLNDEILQINWAQTKNVKYSNIKQELQTIYDQENDINILINGDKSFIEIVNQNIEKALTNIRIKNNITIINCYDVTQFTNVSQITDEHDFILNTSGIKQTHELFKKEEKKNA